MWKHKAKTTEERRRKRDNKETSYHHGKGEPWSPSSSLLHGIRYPSKWPPRITCAWLSSEQTLSQSASIPYSQSLSVTGTESTSSNKIIICIHPFIVFFSYVNILYHVCSKVPLTALLGSCIVSHVLWGQITPKSSLIHDNKQRTSLQLESSGDE